MIWNNQHFLNCFYVSEKYKISTNNGNTFRLKKTTAGKKMK